jgi:hypothetical protein
MTAETDQLPLQGQWSVRLDPEDNGVDQAWYAETLEETIHLPGTTDEARLGQRTMDRPTERLSRRFKYEGAAWYQRTVTVPPSWEDRHVSLFLERTRPTMLWVDEKRVGARRSLTTPHVYDLTELVAPGEHTLTLRVDNDAPVMSGDGTMLGDTHGVGLSHMATEHTQCARRGARPSRPETPQAGSRRRPSGAHPSPETGRIRPEAQRQEGPRPPTGGA